MLPTQESGTAARVGYHGFQSQVVSPEPRHNYVSPFTGCVTVPTSSPRRGGHMEGRVPALGSPAGRQTTVVGCCELRQSRPVDTNRQPGCPSSIHLPLSLRLPPHLRDAAS